MKKIVLSILIFTFYYVGNAQVVNIPDANFKAYLVGNSFINTNSDSEIQVSEATAYTDGIYVSNLGISDLTGIEAFTSIYQFICSNNQLTSIDVSNNTNLSLLDCSNNQLTSLNVSNNNLLTLRCQNNLLTSLNINTPSLATLWCQNNLLTSLDISNLNWNYIDCSNNQLTSLSVGAGNMNNFEGFDARINNLTCINVDDVGYSTTTWANIDSLVSFSLNCLACTIYIPDVNFKTYLVGNPLINVNGDGEIQCSEAYAFTGAIDAGFLSIADLTGIEAFVHVTELNCTSNQLTNIDVTQNVNLINLYCGVNQLTTLNVTQNIVLIDLICASNDLTGLDVASNLKLTNLRCNNNLITSLNISQNIDLSLLYCSINQITNLDVKSNTSLVDFRCDTNQLLDLDVSLNTNLKRLKCDNNGLTKLNVKNGNNTNFTLFDATNNPNLICINVDDEAWSKINWINIDSQTSFSQFCGFTYIPDDNFEQVLIDLGYDTVLDDYVLTSNINTITSLNVSNKSITSLIGVKDFVTLETLVCSTNSLTTLDVSKNIALTDLRCQNNNLTGINVTQNTGLTRFWCLDNQLTSLDISQNILLNDFSCNNNLLTSLNVLNNIALTVLACRDNQITDLDVSNNTLLEFFSCHTNQLTSLDVSQSPNLVRLWCYNNLLNDLDFRNGSNTSIANGNFNAANNPNLTCISVDDVSWSTTNWTNIDPASSFSINCSAINIGIVIFFQGAYINPVLGEETLMRDNLRVAGLIPTTSPYADALTCDASVFTPTGSNAIVDWVWIELRDKNDNTNILISQSALLQRDGDIVAVNGVSPISFALSDDDYFVSISHRNHLGIVSANTIELSASMATLNLSNDITKVNGGSNAVVDLGNGIFALYAGDYDGNGQVQNTDLTGITPLLGQPSTYDDADLDMNTQVQNTDLNNLLNPNKGRGQQAKNQDLKLYAKRKE